jgi:hypothetical protein
MLPNHLDFLTRQTQYQDLLREAEHERLIRTTALQASSIRWAGLRGLANRLGTYLTQFGRQLRAGHFGRSAYCGECCPVALNAPVPDKIIF